MRECERIIMIIRSVSNYVPLDRFLRMHAVLRILTADCSKNKSSQISRDIKWNKNGWRRVIPGYWRSLPVSLCRIKHIYWTNPESKICWFMFTHCGLMASKILINFGSGNVLSPGGTKPWPESILIYWQLRTNCSDILIIIHSFHWRNPISKCRLQVLFRSQCFQP